jgi:hypothetical protein
LLAVLTRTYAQARFGVAEVLTLPVIAGPAPLGVGQAVLARVRLRPARLARAALDNR